MKKTNKKPHANIPIGIALIILAFAALIIYFSKIRSYENSDIFYVFLFVLLSGLAFFLMPKHFKADALYRLWLLLCVEFFLRATIYGRPDFFEYTIFEADSARRTFFFENKVNLVPLASIKCVLGLPFSGIFTNIFGNIGLIVPVSFLFPLAFPNPKSKFIVPFLSGVLLSVSVEFLQLFFMCGAADVDDLFLNSLGSLIGAALIYCFKTGKKASRK